MAILSRALSLAIAGFLDAYRPLARINGIRSTVALGISPEERCEFGVMLRCSFVRAILLPPSS